MFTADEKIGSRAQAATLREAAKAKGQRVGFTTGTFDILHPGHVRYLELAKQECDLLIVGVNSDSSVKSYKGPKRPIQDEATRALIVAALASVDFVFLFDEPKTKVSIELLKPDVYIKGGDYTVEKLGSAPIVQAYGGSVKIVPFVEGNSTTGVIEKIVQRFSPKEALSLELPPYELRPAVFLDRDGTIIEHVEYLHEPEKVVIFPGAIDAMKRMQAAGARIVIVTNQPGIGNGYFTKEDFFRVNREMLRAAGREGLRIDRIYFCPHSVGDECSCRKPRPGMIERAKGDLNLDLSRSFMIGDMTSDIEVGRVTGCRTILVQTGGAGADNLYQVTPDYSVNTLVEAADIVVAALSQGELAKSSH